MKAAINAGFSRVFLTLVDTHMAALHCRGVPVPVRHRPDSRVCRHAVLRADLSNLFTSIFVSKTLFEMELAATGKSRRYHI